LFGECIVLTAVGTFAKIYLRIQKGWDLKYASLDWKERNLVFSGLSLKDDHCFSLVAPEATISIQNKHIKIDRPIVSITQIPPMDNFESSNWTILIGEGSIQVKDLPEASFSLKQNPLQAHGRIHIHFGDASISIEMSANSNIPFILAYLTRNRQFVPGPGLGAKARIWAEIGVSQLAP
jgi:hypothetical protein